MVEKLAAEFAVSPAALYLWPEVVIETEVPDTVSTEPDPTPAPNPESPTDTLSRMRAQLDAIQADLYASEGSPLERDLALWDRDPEELQGATGGALRHCRDRLRLSLHNVSQLAGIPSKRLTELETRTGEPPALHEIRQLREALGVEFDPRAVAFSDRDNPHPTLEESLREYREEWVRQRPPSKLDRILLLLERLSDRVVTMERRLSNIDKKIIDLARET